jgi:RNA polymerase sigma factor (sigma-70 family)
MADRESDHAPVQVYLFKTTVLDGETATQRAWDRDIRRAARAAANGHGADAQDYAQEARLRVLLANRSMPDAPTPYVRAVISNTLKSVRRANAKAFSSNSSMSEAINDNIPQPTPDNVDDRISSLMAWMGSLPSSLQQVYRHLYGDGLSQREAARLMKLSQPRVAQLHRQLVSRARKYLTHLAA